LGGSSTGVRVLEVTSESSVKRMGGISWNSPVDLFLDVFLYLQAPVPRSVDAAGEVGSRQRAVVINER
jgi:hypothetical protein